VRGPRRSAGRWRLGRQPSPVSAKGHRGITQRVVRGRQRRPCRRCTGGGLRVRGPQAPRNSRGADSRSGSSSSGVRVDGPFEARFPRETGRSRVAHTATRTSLSCCQ
jgi:hypothetical protein